MQSYVPWNIGPPVKAAWTVKTLGFLSLVPRLPDFFRLREGIGEAWENFSREWHHGTEEVKDPPTINLHAVLQTYDDATRNSRLLESCSNNRLSLKHNPSR